MRPVCAGAGSLEGPKAAFWERRLPFTFGSSFLRGCLSDEARGELAIGQFARVAKPLMSSFRVIRMLYQ